MMDFFNLIADMLAAGGGEVTELLMRASKGNSVAAGLGLVALSGWIMYRLRTYPVVAAKALVRRFTTSIRVEMSEGYMMYNYFAVGDFISRHLSSRHVHIERAEMDTVNGTQILSVAPYHQHGWFFVGFRPVWFKRVEAATAPSGRALGGPKLTITALGLDHRRLCSLVGFDQVGLKFQRTRGIFEWTNGNHWNHVDLIRTFSPIFLSEDVKAAIDKVVDNFVASREWKLQRGLNHKLLIVVHGKPGSGKSKISQYVAERLSWNLGSIPSSSGLIEALRDEPRMVKSIPDFDTIGVGANRVAKSSPGLADVPAASPMSTLLAPSLGEVLNYFEGDIPIRDSAVVMSTNHIERVDGALLRSSRCDLVIELPDLTYREANMFYHYFLETTNNLPEELREIKITAGDLKGAFDANFKDEQGFVNMLRAYMTDPGIINRY